MKPRKIMAKKTKFINDINSDIITFVVHRGWHIYVTRTNRGMCYGHKKIITVPFWVFEKEGAKRGKDYYLYYMFHELAHALVIELTGDYHGAHGKAFMRYFKSICPVHLQHHELDYKPKLAKAAGIKKP